MQLFCIFFLFPQFSYRSKADLSHPQCKNICEHEKIEMNRPEQYDQNPGLIRTIVEQLYHITKRTMIATIIA